MNMNQQIAGVILLLAATCPAETITLEPSKDATLYEVLGGAYPASGKGEALFSGRVAANNGGTLRRMLTEFDLSAIPPNATIESATLTFLFVLNQNRATTHVSTLYVVTTDWNEGPAEPFNNGGGGANASTTDVTWAKTGIEGADWVTVGGDFVATPSASGLAPAEIDSPLTFTSSQMVADLQSWVSGTTPNYGWMILVDESGELQTARGFGSRENVLPANRPRLEITYSVSELSGSDEWFVY